MVTAMFHVITNVNKHSTENTDLSLFLYPLLMILEAQFQYENDTVSNNINSEQVMFDPEFLVSLLIHGYNPSYLIYNCYKFTSCASTTATSIFANPMALI